jgi:hypothetical protein
MTTHLTERFSPAVDSGESFSDRTAYFSAILRRVGGEAIAQTAAAETVQPPEITVYQQPDTFDRTGLEA